VVDANANNGRWDHGWFRIGDPHFGDGFTVNQTSTISAVARQPNHLDLFVVGKMTRSTARGGMPTLVMDAGIPVGSVSVIHILVMALPLTRLQPSQRLHASRTTLISSW